MTHCLAWKSGHCPLFFHPSCRFGLVNLPDRLAPRKLQALGVVARGFFLELFLEVA